MSEPVELHWVNGAPPRALHYFKANPWTLQTAAALKSNPHQWGKVFLGDPTQARNRCVSLKNQGCEAVTRKESDSQHAVWARYVS